MLQKTSSASSTRLELHQHILWVKKYRFSKKKSILFDSLHQDPPISDTSCKCYICGATPKMMNDIDNCLNKKVETFTYELGLSPLHSYIRFFEYFIHISYRLDIKKWQIRSTDEKGLFEIRKKKMQSEFREK